MRVIAAPNTDAEAWCEEFFPDMSLCTLPLAGKPLVEYITDYCSLLPVTRMLILDTNYDSSFAGTLEEKKEQWPMEVTYHGASAASSVGQLLRRNAGFVESSDVLLFFGPVVPMPKSPDDILLTNLTEATEEDGNHAGIFCRKRGVLYRYTGPLLHIASLRKYFDGNFLFLEDACGHSLPGYTSKVMDDDGGEVRHVHIGFNVILKQGWEIEPRVLLNDHVCLERNVRLLNGVIIGTHSIVGENTILDHSIVFDNTYIGNDMEFKDKIVHGKRIIDPITGVYVDPEEEDGFSDSMSPMLKNRQIILFFLERLTLLAIIVFGYLPYILFCGKRFSSSLWGRKFSVDRYGDACAALRQHGHLVRRSTRDHRPYVFTAAELEEGHTTPELQEMADTAFRNELNDPKKSAFKNYFLMLRIAFNGTIRRLFTQI